MEVVCVRIGNFNGDPERVIDHPHQLSNGDCVRVFEAAISHPGVKYEIVFGVSDSSWPLCKQSQKVHAHILRTAIHLSLL
jgi:hypothetical protein